MYAESEWTNKASGFYNNSSASHCMQTKGFRGLPALEAWGMLGCKRPRCSKCSPCMNQTYRTNCLDGQKDWEPCKRGLITNHCIAFSGSTYACWPCTLLYLVKFQKIKFKKPSIAMCHNLPACFVSSGGDAGLEWASSLFSAMTAQLLNINKNTWKRKQILKEELHSHQWRFKRS